MIPPEQRGERQRQPGMAHKFMAENITATVVSASHWAVEWSHTKNGLIYVSDPFSDKKSAQAYADFRARHGCIATVWEITKVKVIVGEGRQLGEENGN